MVGPASRPSQDTVKNGSFRREKSDIVGKPRRTQSPANVSAIPRPARSNSSVSLKQDNSLVRSRSQSPAGLQREVSDVTKRSSPSGLRREKSDIVRPRGQSRTNTLGDISRSSSNRSLTSNPLSKSPSISSVEESRSRSGSRSEMSKIPSLVRSPASAEKSDSHVSRIPSLAKQNGTEERTPPKSKIPSMNKADKGQEAFKKTQIPSVGRKDSASQKEKPVSKIPGSSALSQNRPDSAKENKDPTVTTNGHEPVKQTSKIPSFGKGALPKPKIPSVARKDSQNEASSTQNGKPEVHSPVSDMTKSKIPGAAPSQQGTGIPMGISRIPSFTKSPSAPAKHDQPVSNQTRIPPPSKAPALESKIPAPGGSKIPAKSPPSSLPIAPKTSGIPKPGEQVQGSRIPGVPVETGIQMASSSVEPKNKIPKLTSTPKSNVPNENEAAAVTKPKRSIPTLGGRQPSMEKESSSPAEPTTPPSTPTRKDVAESPLDKYIFTEAKKMEQLLRDEPMEVEVADGVELQDEDEFLRQEREIEEQEKLQREKELKMLDSKEAEDLISEVLKSYAPEISNENKVEDMNMYTEKDDNKNIAEKVNIDDIVLEPTKSGNKAVKEPQVQEQPPSKLDSKVEKPVCSVTDDSKKDVPSLKLTIPTEKAGEIEVDEKADKETSKTQGAGIDALGEYAQHARRSRSRQRKIVTPDSEESEKEFLAESENESPKEDEEEEQLQKDPGKEQPKKDIKKDKYGTAPFEGEKKPKDAAKSAKSKSKSDKPKFVIESSLGKDFYGPRKSSESVASRDSVHDDAVKSSFKPGISALVFENKTVREPFTLKHTDAPHVDQAASVEDAEFVDVDLNAEPAIVKQRRELSRSVDDLDEKTVKCMCGRGGKCSIM